MTVNDQSFGIKFWKERYVLASTVTNSFLFFMLVQSKTIDSMPSSRFLIDSRKLFSFSMKKKGTTYLFFTKQAIHQSPENSQAPGQIFCNVNDFAVF